MALSPQACEDPDDDNSTVRTAVTPPESDATGLHDGPRGLATTQHIWPKPQVGRTFLIKIVSSNHVITLRGGAIILCEPDGRASQWECIEDNGWLGFRNAVSGIYLGRDSRFNMCCSAGWHKSWERFQIHEKPEGMGSVLLMEHWGLKHVGIKKENQVARLEVIKSWEADEVIWEFVEV